MSTTSTRTSADGQGAVVDLLGQLTPGRAVRRRNWSRVAAALALAVFCGGVFVILYASAGGRHPYLAVARSISAGETITASDLSVAHVQSDSALSPIPANEANAVVGHRAAVALAPGTLLTPADLASGPLLGAGEASVGLDLKPGQVPGNLSPGTSVIVIDTAGSQPASASGTSGPGSVLVSRAAVLNVSLPTANSANGDTEVTLAVPADVAAEVATAAAAGDIAVAALGGSGGGS